MPTIREKLAAKQSKLTVPQTRTDDHPANLNNFHEGSFCLVDIGLIIPDPNQPRKFFDEEALEELSQSISQKGVLQPIIIRKGPDGDIYLVAGERRYRAAKMAGLEKIPAVITKGNPMEIALIENLQRENLKAIEEAEALGRMVEEHDYTHEQLALVIGKARSTITETLSLNKLPEPIREECRRADIFPRRLLVEIAKQKTEAAMLDLFAQIKAQNMGTAEVRDITRGRTPSPARDTETLALEKLEALHKHLHKLNIETLDSERKSKLFLGLQNLKTLIEKILA